MEKIQEENSLIDGSSSLMMMIENQENNMSSLNQRPKSGHRGIQNNYSDSKLGGHIGGCSMIEDFSLE